MKKKEDFTILVTEQNNPNTTDIDTCSTLDLVRKINNEDKKVAEAVEKVLDSIALAIDKGAERLAKGGRLLYFGAGTSGRLGVIDASECPPTYGTAPDTVQGIIAGGKNAVFNAAEGNEDSEQEGYHAVKNLLVTDKDVVVGIAASGRTPYVLGALKAGNEAGALTVGICNNPNVPIMDSLAAFVLKVISAMGSPPSFNALQSGTALSAFSNLITGTIPISAIFFNISFMIYLR
jgi:N-acetylmuramic acid 6-phosphate etherase